MLDLYQTIASQFAEKLNPYQRTALVAETFDISAPLGC
jgi:hypothetical protein